nr:hypothetical protein [Tanacetum cinerariifolium]
MSGCRDNQKVKYPAGSFVGKDLTWWNSQIHARSQEAVIDRFHELARLVPHLVTPENKRIERNGSLKKNHEKRGNSEESSRDMKARDGNKRTRTRNAFATTSNPVRR